MSSESLQKMETEQKKAIAEVDATQSSIKEKLSKQLEQVELLCEAANTSFKENQEEFSADFSRKEKVFSEELDNKLLEFNNEKNKLWEAINEKLVNITKQLDIKIEEFSDNHKNVETIIDGRLEEFRSAQKAAFQELEAALNLLEKHQDATINRFRNVNDSKNNLDERLTTKAPITNRGSIRSHKAKANPPDNSDIPESEAIHNYRVKTSKGSVLTFYSIAIAIALGIFYLFSSGKLDQGLQFLQSYFR